MIIELPNGVVKFIICGETWYLHCDPEYIQLSMQCKTPASPRHKKALMSKSQIKPALIKTFI